MNKPLAVALAAMLTLFTLAAPLCAGEINLFVAASLKEVMNEFSDTYARSHPGVIFKKNYGAILIPYFCLGQCFESMKSLETQRARYCNAL